MNTFFTSDTHWYHANIIKYSNRPFRDVVHMNEGLIQNWNSVVKPEDTVYHLGDFGFATTEKIEGIISRLNGTKHLILGNHDKQAVDAGGFASISPYKEIYLEGQFIVLCHYAMRVWNKSHHGSLMFYGHSHGSLPGTDQSLDVGTDCWDWTPVTLQQIRQRLKTLPSYRNPDHHGRR